MILSVVLCNTNKLLVITSCVYVVSFGYIYASCVSFAICIKCYKKSEINELLSIIQVNHELVYSEVEYDLKYIPGLIIISDTLFSHRYTVFWFS